ncbi:hypothetical protein CRV00_02700 [Malaciobacter molluscorum]|uniref:lysozyme n=1 Tax=Malaciobacter molluscorum TaxID=1032072 RepID=UPI00100C004C|nr:lysozyme [Malaciobacter molluscorum]RXJ96111.1 hypothetical protein CRV00_02700 [Malaciobacter molluscorum]
MKKKINKLGLELIKHFESLKLEAYQDSVGVWTIGWGHTGGQDGSVYEGLKITIDEAEELLKKDLIIFEEGVNRLIQIEINENQFSALVSFSFNLGLENLKKSTLLKYLNNGDENHASKEFVKWSKAGGKRLKGLVKRRLSERNLFCSFCRIIVDNIKDDWETNYLDL